MIMHIHNGIFWLEADARDRIVAERMGFRWHRTPRLCSGRCKACIAGIGKLWWTDLAHNAMTLKHVADNDALAALKSTEQALTDSRAGNVSDVEAFHKNVPCPAGMDYLPYQRAGITYALERKASLIGDEMGLGKTIQAIGVINATPEAKRIMVVCPPSLRMNWVREIEKWSVIGWHIHVIRKEADLLDIPMHEFTDNERRIIIISYNKVGGPTNATITQRLKSIRWDIFIGDEIHYCKNDKSQRSMGVLGIWSTTGELIYPGLVHVCKRVVLLTGTPITNRPVELFPLLRVLDPKELGRSFFRYGRRYCGGTQGKFGWDFSGASNLPELQRKLRARVMVRRLKKDVLKELPPKRRQILALDPEGHDQVIASQAVAYVKHETAMDQLEAAAEMALALGDEGAFREVGRMMVEARSIAFKELAKERRKVALAKVPAVIEHIENVLESSESRILVFGWHKDVLSAIRDHFKTPLMIVGDTPTQKRQGIVDDFQAGKHRVFIGNIQSAGVGITLTAADTVIFAELDWVPANMMQAEDRAHRIGQKNAVLVQYLVFDGSVDSKMVKTLIDKMEIIEKALDTDEAGDEMAKVYAAEQKRSAANQQLYPAATREMRDAAAEVVRDLAAASGVDKMDTRFGKELLIRSLQRDLTDAEVATAATLAARYRDQLSVEAVGTLVVAECLGVIDLV